MEVIEKNLRELSLKTHVHIRIPLIHGFNDDIVSLEGFVNFFNSLNEAGGSFDVELLPYHEYGKEKYEKLGKEYTVCDGFVTDNDVKALANEIKKRNLKLINT